ncbi:BTB/POZ domain-containing protein DOT3-like [Juglans regia]|uniref:BTB/POZ domain-containing protein DOT3-like n=2 Tax=Juglans regia TaxID=51240 RepID=A0A2I4FS66_JUGRE|nr:BTB/POZ domain-containing protein DOT3-like [Juglans regia]
MKKSPQVARVSRPPSPGSDSDGNDQVDDQSIIIPGAGGSSKLNATANSFQEKELWWFVPSPMPTDLSVQVQGIAFNVHKYPLVSKCGYIHRLELQPSILNSGYDVKLENFPGGSETFEFVLKFCYGLPVDFNSNNIAPLRCASEFLEMTEEFGDGNLITKTEAFLTFVVLSSWKDTITVLKSCETLSPWAENLQIVRRCCDSIAWKASREILTTGDEFIEEGWWFDDAATLHMDHFIKIIAAIRSRGTKPEIIGKCIMHYADRWLPGMDMELGGLRGYGHGKNELPFSVYSGKEEGGSGNSKEQKTIIESLVSILPPQQEAVSCKFLFKMLKMAMVYSATPELISELEKRLAMMLEDANVNDLLVPSYKNSIQGKLVNSEQCTMHDIDVVQRIVDYFLMQEKQQQQQKSRKCNISKILDNYLAEIARDPNLSITKFQVLAESLPENARPCHDGLYRAIDTYLKTHPSLSEHDRRRLCKIMNCEKLSFDACMHAAQNDRLPLRTVVQVLFSEQVKMRAVMQEKEPAPSGNISEQEGNQSSTDAEIKMLKTELEVVKMNIAELQNDYSDLQREYEKLGNKQTNIFQWSFSWRKIKNSFHTKVEGKETGAGKQIPNHFRRRLSIS